jgi:ACS family hexuronate transporter-like MFS transporter
MSRVRWFMLALLFFATTINYLDRIVFSVLIPVIRKELDISDQYCYAINGAFQAAYTVGYVFMGRLDRVGTRWATRYRSPGGRLPLPCIALAERDEPGILARHVGPRRSGNPLAAIKSVAEWFPKRDRALATGIFNAGANVAS